MIKYVFLFFPQPKQAPNQTDTQCVHQTISPYKASQGLIRHV